MKDQSSMPSPVDITQFQNPASKDENQYEAAKNTLPQAKGASGMSVFFFQFKSPLTHIILIATIISLIVGKMADFAILI